MANFEVGDAVQWTSQAGGNTKSKVGKVVAVIPGGRDSASRAKAEIRARARTHRSAFGGGWDRVETSYLVEVPQGTTGKAKPVLYWPIASKLAAA